MCVSVGIKVREGEEGRREGGKEGRREGKEGQVGEGDKCE